MRKTPKIVFLRRHKTIIIIFEAISDAMFCFYVEVTKWCRVTMLYVTLWIVDITIHAVYGLLCAEALLRNHPLTQGMSILYVRSPSPLPTFRCKLAPPPTFGEPVGRRIRAIRRATGETFATTVDRRYDAPDGRHRRRSSGGDRSTLSRRSPDQNRRRDGKSRRINVRQPATDS